MWETKIKKVENGFILAYQEEALDCNPENLKYVTKEILFEEQEDNKEHIVNLLYQILEYFGELGSKHDKERIRIGVEKNEG